MAEDQNHSGVVIVALPSADHPVHGVSSEEAAHVTLAYLGTVEDYVASGDTDDPDIIGMLQDELSQVAVGAGAPVGDKVSGRGTLGPNGADVLLLNGDAIQPLHDMVMASPTMGKLAQLAGAFPSFIPHLTLGYPETPALAEPEFGEIVFDRLALWAGETRTEFPLGGQMDPEIAPEADDEIDPDAPAMDDIEDDEDEFALEPIPWHGVMTIEAAPSGDRRGFAASSIRVRDLPVPLQYQKVSDEDHKGSVVVGRIDRVERDAQGRIWGYGVFNDTPEADAAIGMLADRSIRGVSVDLDDVTAEYSPHVGDEEGPPDALITDGRIAGATLCAIPAFQEAYVALGEGPDDFNAPKPGEDPGEVEDDDLDEEYRALVASAMAEFAPGTKDGPGWVTHPKATSRIRAYWTRGKGAAKIKWGLPNDFYRCRNQLRKYVQNPDWLNGLCANMHKEVLGVWPGQEAVVASLECADCEPATALVASAAPLFAGQWVPNGELFRNPKLQAKTPLTVEKVGEDLHIYGHAFTWDACHTAEAGTCLAPPQSPTDYSRFLVGTVTTTDGEQAVGQITVDLPHASRYASARVAMAHYDSTEHAVADVAFGEDEIGGWYSGVIRPWAAAERIHALKATGVSGDWRDFGQGLDLIGVLGVNVGGFNNPRPKVQTAHRVGQDGIKRQVALLAAGYVEPEPDLQALVAAAVQDELDLRARRAKVLSIGPEVFGTPSQRIQRLAATFPR